MGYTKSGSGYGHVAWRARQQWARWVCREYVGVAGTSQTCVLVGDSRILAYSVIIEAGPA